MLLHSSYFCPLLVSTVHRAMGDEGFAAGTDGSCG